MTGTGYAKLLEHEGEVLHAYRDSQGFLTIGVGHLIDPARGGSIPQRVSRELFEDDIARATASTRAHFGDWFDGLDAVRQDVIVMLVFNMGVGGLEGFRLMIEAIKQQDWQQAAYELFNSKWAKQVQAERVKDLCDALEHSRWEHPSFV